MSSRVLISQPDDKIRIEKEQIMDNAVRIIAYTGTSYKSPPYENLFYEQMDEIATQSNETNFFKEDTIVQYEGDAVRIGFKNQENDIITENILQHGTIEKPVITFTKQSDELYYGFGEWFNGFARNKGQLTLHNLESPCFKQNKQTYSAFPLFMSSKGYMVFILNAHRAIVNIEPNSLVLNYDGGTVDYLFIYGPAFKQLISTYTSITGRSPMVPIWALGIWNTGYPVENQEETINRIKKHREEKIPLDAVIFDYHWQYGFSNFEWQPDLFPDPEKMIKECRELGIKLGCIYTPYVNNINFNLLKLLVRIYVKNSPDGIYPWTDFSAKKMYNEALDKGFFTHPKISWWLGTGGGVDFTNPDAVKWWGDAQKKLLKQGIKFFKNDGGEYIPENGKSHNGMTGSELHNIYALYYAKAVYEQTQKAAENERVMVFSRSTWAGSQRYPGIFLGDQTPKFKFMQSTMKCGLNMSLQGFAYWCADTLGLYRTPGKEEHIRYPQWTIFNPITRYFSTSSRKREPWGRGEKNQESFREHANLKMRLLPLYYRLAWEAWRYGTPIVRPLMLEHNDDPETYQIWDQYLLGNDLMFCPVLEKGAKSRRIYFPAGSWFDFWNNKPIEEKGWTEYTVRRDRVPIFANMSSILVMGTPLQYIPDNHRFNNIELQIFPAANSESYLYEDDTRTLNYKQGEHATQKFSCRQSRDRITLILEPSQGEFMNKPTIRSYRVVIRGTTAYARAKFNGQVLLINKAEEDLIVNFDLALSERGELTIDR